MDFLPTILLMPPSTTVLTCFFRWRKQLSLFSFSGGTGQSDFENIYGGFVTTYFAVTSWDWHHLSPYCAICFFRRSHASITVSLGANALSRRYPSPPGPKPAPGIVTTCAFSKISEKVSQLLFPSGSLTNTYGASV